MKRLIEALTVLLILVLLIVFLWPFSRRGPGSEPKISLVDAEMNAFLLAMQSYQSAFGCFPSGNTSNVVQSLVGKNPRSLQFLNLTARSTDSNGQFVDPWGTPYQIIVDSNVTVCSAGPNKLFGDKDDIVHQ